MKMKKFWVCGFLGAAFGAFSVMALAQTASISAKEAPAQAALVTDPWEIGAFFQGGLGVGDRSDFTFTSAGVRLGKVITNQHLPGILRGQFEYAGELMPYWEAFTPPPHIGEVKYEYEGQTGYVLLPYGGGTYTGFSITPIILRWNFAPSRRFAPWLQGAGGLVYTPHKFPPDILVPHGTPGGTSVFNFTPQGGIGFHYFINPRRSIDFAASAIHISSASLGDRNPGVNASVQFQIGYTWWH
ncbi:MAG: acyloxyacyl hydrolase [Acidobacteriaceae bacterium]